jgi:TATA-box binding protein (TBP) (component of TFIID and TFIIIB)
LYGHLISIKEEKEMYSDYEPLRIPNGYRELKNIDSVFISDGKIVITGWPDEDDESHNCDAMGCSSVSHVIFRADYTDSDY